MDSGRAGFEVARSIPELPATCLAIKIAFHQPAKPRRNNRTSHQAQIKGHAPSVSIVWLTFRPDDEKHGDEIKDNEGACRDEKSGRDGSCWMSLVSPLLHCPKLNQRQLRNKFPALTKG